jgi:hypothetical protein
MGPLKALDLGIYILVEIKNQSVGGSKICLTVTPGVKENSTFKASPYITVS